MTPRIEEKIKEFVQKTVGLGFGATNQERMSNWLRQALTAVAEAQKQSDVEVLEGIKREHGRKLHQFRKYVAEIHNTALDEAITKILG